MTPEQALALLCDSDGTVTYDDYLLKMEQGEYPLERAERILRECIRDAKRWRANKDAVLCANAMLQAARPTILNMLNMEQAAEEY